MPLDPPLAALRVLREVAQSGSFSASARALGYTQSAVSRQIAGLEAHFGRPLVERRRDGSVLTPAGARLLERASRALDELDAAQRELDAPGAGRGPVRLGAFPTAIAGLLPAVLTALRDDGLTVTVREASTPALALALRAGTLDLGVLAQTPPFRPPDGEAPPLELTVLAERELVLAVGERHPFAARGAVEVTELEDQVWIAGRGGRGDTGVGVWPGVAGRPDVRYVVSDWLARLELVAAGLGITTLAPVAAPALPPGVRTVAVRGEPHETRRLVLARRAGALDPAVAAVADALTAAARAGSPR
jgi:molybdate transport repressor ModE-like protein